MRHFTLIVAFLAASAAMSSGPAAAFCAQSPCEPMRIAPAIANGVPLIWSTRRGGLIGPGAEPPLQLGPMIPLSALVDRRVVRVGPALREVNYNAPDSFIGAVDPELRLVPLPAPRHIARRRGEYP